MKFELTTPRVVKFELTQERNDPDYGSCLWAIFTLDLDRYSMQIISECGNYTYSWCPTPNTESFLHLVSRMEKEYLLEKISSQVVVDADATYKAVIEYLKALKEHKEIEEGDSFDPWSIRIACIPDGDWTDCYESLISMLNATCYYGKYSFTDLASCIETDYPRSAKKIGKIFEKYIQPKVKELAEEEQGHDRERR